MSAEEYVQQAQIHAADMQYRLAQEQLRPFHLLRPTLGFEGDKWCYLHGPNLAEGLGLTEPSRSPYV